MKDIIKEILEAIPKFILSFIDILGQPRTFFTKQVPSDEKKLTDALVFLGVSLAITLIIKLPLLPDNVDNVKYLASDAVWKITILLVITLVMKVAWIIVGSKIDFKDLLMLNTYCFGALSVVSHLILLIAFTTKANSPAASDVILISGSFALFGWSVIYWNTYRLINNQTLSKGLLVLIATIIISIPVLWVLMELRYAFNLGKLPL